MNTIFTYRRMTEDEIIEVLTEMFRQRGIALTEEMLDREVKFILNTQWAPFEAIPYLSSVANCAMFRAHTQNW